MFSFVDAPAPPGIYTLSLHDALPISTVALGSGFVVAISFGTAVTFGGGNRVSGATTLRSEEHTSELQSRGHLVCRLLLEKKKSMKHTALTVHRLHAFQAARPIWAGIA